ncbi:hypothetical protein [Ileibacterium valens]|uniref:hypothetical protein n=1 Tax=Ileibacterium valens TaxID=1862668 RepID=UPI0025734AF0|nr:hypothetical protein [Ileibacterium valens]
MMNPSGSQNQSFASSDHSEHKNTRFQNTENYLSYGERIIDPAFDLRSVLNFLNEKLPGSNKLTEIRTRKSFYHSPVTSELKHYCAVCGRPMSLAHAQKMNNGFLRCSRCAFDEVRNEEEFEKLFLQAKENFEVFFGTTLPKGIKANLQSEVPSTLDSTLPYSESSELCTRLGRVIQKDDEYTIYVCPGIGRQACLFALVASFTEIWISKSWGFANMNEQCNKIDSRLSRKMMAALIHGMRQWAAVEYFYLSNEKIFAKENKELAKSANTPESKGFLLYEKTYPFKERKQQDVRHPFMNRIPLDLYALANAFGAENEEEQSR